MPPALVPAALATPAGGEDRVMKRAVLRAASIVVAAITVPAAAFPARRCCTALRC